MKTKRVYFALKQTLNTNCPVETSAYTYDALGRSVSRNADAFAYNIRSEVTNAIFHSPFSIFHSYGYDNIGNSTNHEANCLNQYAQFTYDARGNMTQCGEWTYACDSGNRLVSVTSNGLPVASFAYDAQGRRVKKVAADGTYRYFYDGWLLIREHLTRPDNTVSETQYCCGTDFSGTMQGAGGVGGLLYFIKNVEANEWRVFRPQPSLNNGAKTSGPEARILKERRIK